MIKNNQIPVSIIIPTLGDAKIEECLKKINESRNKPSEILIVVPKQNLKKVKNIKLKFKTLDIKIIPSNKRDQVFQRILGFKKSKYNFVMQLDDDVKLERDCLIKLFEFLKARKNSAVAPRYTDKIILSKIYKKPNNLLLKYHKTSITSHWPFLKSVLMHLFSWLMLVKILNSASRSQLPAVSTSYPLIQLYLMLRYSILLPENPWVSTYNRQEHKMPGDGILFS